MDARARPLVVLDVLIVVVFAVLIEAVFHWDTILLSVEAPFLVVAGCRAFPQWYSTSGAPLLGMDQI